MSMQPEISVIVPVYNTEAYLNEAVESVLQQSFSDWELILVDDGSTDASGSMCDAWAERDARIRVIHTQNGGASCARNTGLSLAQGNWVFFLDSDDRIRKHALETMLQNGEDADIVICRMMFFPKMEVGRGVEQSVFYDCFADMAPDFHRYFGKNILTSASTKLYRRASIQCRFDESIRHAEDALFILDYLPSCKGIRILPDVLYEYRREEVTSLSKRFWVDTPEISVREMKTVLRLFPGNEWIQRLAVQKMMSDLERWTQLLMMQKMSESEKMMFLELYLPVCEEIHEVDHVRMDGLSGQLWQCMKAQRMDQIVKIFDEPEKHSG